MQGGAVSWIAGQAIGRAREESEVGTMTHRCEFCHHWDECDNGDGRCAILKRRTHYTFLCYRWAERVVVVVEERQMRLMEDDDEG
jgi:uncharacterized protein YlaI